VGSALIDALHRLVTPELLVGASAALGEPEAALVKGFRATFPALLAPLADRAGDTTAMQRLAALANDPALDSRLLASPSRALDAVSGGGSSTGLAALAAALLPLALGERADATASALARYAGLGGASSGHALLALASPLVLALVRERSEREGLGTAGLGRWLGTQREALRGALPPALERTPPARPSPPAAASPRRPVWLLPLLLVIGLVALWALLRGEREPATPGGPPPVAAPPPGGAGARP
jgi:hypothetical protein